MKRNLVRDWGSGLPDAWLSMLGRQVPDVLLVCRHMHDSVSASDLVSSKMDRADQDGRTLVSSIVRNWHAVNVQTPNKLKRRTAKEILQAVTQHPQVRPNHLIEAYCAAVPSFQAALVDVHPGVLPAHAVHDIHNEDTSTGAIIAAVVSKDITFFKKCIEEQRMFVQCLKAAATYGDAGVLGMFIDAGAWNLLDAFESASADADVYARLLDADPTLAATRAARGNLEDAIEDSLLHIADTLVSRGVPLDITLAIHVLRQCVEDDHTGPVLRAAAAMLAADRHTHGHIHHALMHASEIGSAGFCTVLHESCAPSMTPCCWSTTVAQSLVHMRLPGAGPHDETHPMLQFYLSVANVDSMLVLHTLVKSRAVPPAACKRMLQEYPSEVCNWTNIAIEAVVCKNRSMLEWVLTYHFRSLQLDAIVHAIVSMHSGSGCDIPSEMFELYLKHVIPHLDDPLIALLSTRFTSKYAKQFVSRIQVDDKLVSHMVDTCLDRKSMKPLLGLVSARALDIEALWRSVIDARIHHEPTLRELLRFSRPRKAWKDSCRVVAEYALKRCHYTVYLAITSECL